MRTTSLIFLVALFFVAANISLPVYGQGQNEKEIHYKQLSKEERWKQAKNFLRELQKTSQDDERHDQFKETIVNGNQIRVLLTNQGSISTPSADNANADLVWPNGPTGLGYAYEFGPMLAAEVIDENGDTIHAVSEGFIDGGDFEPGTGGTVRWGWEPKLGFSDPSSNEVATFSDLDRNLDGKPDSWPESWYNEALGRYVWPAFLGDDATTPDEEVYYVMDDFDNEEFNYLPIPGDPSIHGLALELQVRIFQFNNPLAEDIIFLVYTVTNVGQKTLEKVFLGMFGDPHVGGPGDFSDDNAGFISAFNNNPEFATARNMLYAWDEDGIGDGGKTAGYFGYRFLESPSIEDDGQDNDGDELIDESPFNDAGSFIFGPIGEYGDPKEHWSGDEDGDWNVEFDDVGVDGIAGTQDFGENDGKPNQRFYLDVDNNGSFDIGEPTSETRLEGYRFDGGEPNFGFLDVAESDQLGLTSFNALLFGGNSEPRNDELMWNLMSTPNQRPSDPPPVIEQEADNVFIYSSGPFVMEPGESQRFSIALLMGEDFNDLLQNATASQQVFEADYRFAKPPQKPTLTAVPGDRKVTLFWDTAAETSFDPFIARSDINDPNAGFDFEGYRIYRSQDESFNDTKTITDSRGNPFLSEPLKFFQAGQQLPAQFDLINEFQGLSDVEYLGRGVRFDLGNNSGLVHSFVDSNNVINGVTYFYALTAYDHGGANAKIAPSETQRTILRDAVTRQFTFDINTAMVVPGPPAIGFVDAGLSSQFGNFASHVAGKATGSVEIKILDDFKVEDNKKFNAVFDSLKTDTGSVLIYYIVEDAEKTVTFNGRDTLFVSLGLPSSIYPPSAVLKDAAGNELDTSQYQLLPLTGRIRGRQANVLPASEQFTLTYQAAPVYQSALQKGEDGNPVFDGLRVKVFADETQLDSLSTHGGQSGFTTITTSTNFSDEFTRIDNSGVGFPAPYPGDFEIRFVDYDTTASGDLSAPADSAVITNVKTPFRIIDVESGERVDFFIQEPSATRNGRWDWQETIELIKPNAQQITETTYKVDFSPPKDTTETGAIIIADPIYPGEGDIFLLFSKKSFGTQDIFTFTTKAAFFENQKNQKIMDNIIVVPNPYVAVSASEIGGIRTGDRDDRIIQFRNLPPKCTIRIYTLVGELVDRIEKNDNSSFVSWRILSFESQDISYGVYIYHVDAPGIGAKIGRIGIIK